MAHYTRSSYLRLSINNFISSMLGLLMGLTIFFLALRFLLRLFGANAAHPLINWLYETSYIVLAPFIGIFPNSRLGNGSVFEFNTLFAILIYLIVFSLILELLDFFNRRYIVVED